MGKQSRMAVGIVAGLLAAAVGLGCGGYEMPEGVRLDVPPDVETAEECIAEVRKRMPAVETVRVTCSLDTSGHNFPTARLAMIGDVVRLDGYKLAGTKMFRFYFDGEDFTLVNDFRSTYTQGKADDLTKDRPEMAFLPPDLNGLQLFFPVLEPGENESVALDRDGGHCHLIYRKQRDDGSSYITRRVRVRRDAMLVDRIFVHGPDGGVMGQVEYDYWYLVPVGVQTAEGKAVRRKIPFPHRISFTAPSTEKEVSFVLSVKDGTVEINGEGMEVRYFKLRPPRVYEEKPLKKKESDEKEV